MQGRERAELALEPAPGRAGQRALHELERDLAAVARVEGAIDDAHAPFAELVADLEALVTQARRDPRPAAGRSSSLVARTASTSVELRLEGCSGTISCRQRRGRSAVSAFVIGSAHRSEGSLNVICLVV